VTSKVLIVDDSKLARMAVLKVLNALHPGWTAIEAANADEALVLVKQESPDFVLVDFNMPDKDGLSLAQQLRELNPELHIAVISANHQIDVVKRAHANGAAFLRKPLTDAALAAFLRDPPTSRSRDA
jgi:YesN/AraC family two-component response regulator